jgi:hypothetical protein
MAFRVVVKTEVDISGEHITSIFRDDKQGRKRVEAGLSSACHLLLVVSCLAYSKDGGNMFLQNHRLCQKYTV